MSFAGMLRRAAPALLLVLAACPPGLGESRIEPAVARCREAFPAVVADPGAPGGWFAEGGEGDRLLCLYGSLDRVDVATVTPLHGDRVFDTVVVRSLGGQVRVWLDIAERLEARVDIGIVDEACFSSCANYFSILPRTLRAAPGSLLVWHGGTTGAGFDQGAFGASSIGELLRYYDFASRTEALYARNGIDPRILDDTALPPDAARLGEFAVAGQRTLAGYAVSPARLAGCYGYRNAGSLWHAGSDAQVAALARARSPDLFILESPRPAGAPSCQ